MNKWAVRIVALLMLLRELTIVEKTKDWAAA